MNGCDAHEAGRIINLSEVVKRFVGDAKSITLKVNFVPTDLAGKLVDFRRLPPKGLFIQVE